MLTGSGVGIEFLRCEYHYNARNNHKHYGKVWVYKAGVSRTPHSGLPSERINLSPFTKDFRGGGHTMSVK